LTSRRSGPWGVAWMVSGLGSRHSIAATFAPSSTPDLGFRAVEARRSDARPKFQLVLQVHDRR